MSKLAILGGEPTRTQPYPQWPVHDQREIEAATRVIQSGRWGGYRVAEYQLTQAGVRTTRTPARVPSRRTPTRRRIGPE